MILPFVCLGIGILLGAFIKRELFYKVSEKATTVCLILLMITIGSSIGMDRVILKHFPSIGFHCIVISLCTIFFSIFLTYCCERTVLPLGLVEKELEKGTRGNEAASSLELLQMENERTEIEKKGTSLLAWMMPGGILFGLTAGFLFRKSLVNISLDFFFTVFLAVLYICVGIGQGANRNVFCFIKSLGIKILWLPAAITAGSLMGGVVSGILLKLPFKISVLSAAGMSFYSLTGAYMTQLYGVEAGAYGFIVNLLRECLTILALPFLIKISKGSAIAGGASGDMDTMFAPIIKFTGEELGPVILFTGMILTSFVPFLLPLLSQILK